MRITSIREYCIRRRGPWWLPNGQTARAIQVSNRTLQSSRRDFDAGMGRAVVIAVVGVACGGRSGTRSNRSDFAPVRAFIVDGMAKAHVPSMAVGVARGDTILWEEGFGFADPDRHTPATPATMYYVASVTKLMTATALMELHERGQVDFDRPVNDYLGSERILEPRLGSRGGDRSAGRHAHVRPGDLRRRLLDSRSRVSGADDPALRCAHWRPGERFDYSNLGYGEPTGHLPETSASTTLIGGVTRSDWCCSGAAIMSSTAACGPAPSPASITVRSTRTGSS